MKTIFEFVLDELKDIYEDTETLIVFIIISPICGALTVKILSFFSSFEIFFYSLSILLQFPLYWIIGVPFYLIYRYFSKKTLGSK